MRTFLYKLLFIFVFLFTVSASNKSESDSYLHDFNSIKIEYKEERVINTKEENIRTYFHFLDDLGYFESRNNYEVINKKKYIGRFQFGRSALISTGYRHVNWMKFKKDPDVWGQKDQLIAMRVLLTKNEKHLLEEIDGYSNKMLGDSLRITMSGLLAASHLGGAGRYQTYNTTGRVYKKGLGVKHFLETRGKYNPSDGHMRLSDYMYMFSGYEFEIPSEEDLLAYIEKYQDTY